MFEIQGKKGKLLSWLEPTEIDVVQQSSVYKGYRCFEIFTTKFYDPIQNPKQFVKDAMILNFGYFIFFPFVYLCMRLPEALLKYSVAFFTTPYLVITGQYKPSLKIIFGNLLLAINSITLPAYMMLNCLIFNLIYIPSRMIQTIKSHLIGPERIHEQYATNLGEPKDKVEMIPTKSSKVNQALNSSTDKTDKNEINIEEDPSVTFDTATPGLK